MSMLSTFAILFETDAKKASKETDEFAQSLDDVEKSAEGATGSVDGTTKAYSDNSASVGALTKTMVGLVGALFAVDAIAAKVFDNADRIDAIGKLSQTVGFNIVELDAWGEATARNGGSAEAFRGTVESLQTSLQDMEITGGGEIINTLAMIGVQATKANGEIKSAFEILPEIATAFEGMSTEKSFAFGKRLGLDQGTILTLQQSRYEVDKLVERQKALGGVTKDGYENAAKFNDQWDDSKRSMNSWWLAANNNILPIFTKILKGLEVVGGWVKENQTLVEGFFIGVAGVLTAMYLPAIASVAAATLVAIAPFIAIGAAIVAVGAGIAVLYEDIKAWVSGGKSAIGDLLGSFKEFKDSVLSYFDDIKGGWKALISDIEELNPFKEVGEAIGGGIFNLLHDNGGTSDASNTIASYSNTSLNHGGATSNQTTQQNNITVGGANIDARGMTSGQAKSAFGANMKESVEMAMGQLADGVER